VGLGHDPLDPKQLDFVYEKNLKAAPTYAAMLGYPGFWMRDLDSGIDQLGQATGILLVDIAGGPLEIRRIDSDRVGVVRVGRLRQEEDLRFYLATVGSPNLAHHRLDISNIVRLANDVIVRILR
jgi:hypothetical protein